MAYTFANITPPEGGKITIEGGKLEVPDNPVVPFIRGDGTGPDIWAAKWSPKGRGSGLLGPGDRSPGPIFRASGRSKSPNGGRWAGGTGG